MGAMSQHTLESRKSGDKAHPLHLPQSPSQLTVPEPRRRYRNARHRSRLAHCLAAIVPQLLAEIRMIGAQSQPTLCARVWELREKAQTLGANIRRKDSHAHRAIGHTARVQGVQIRRLPRPTIQRTRAPLHMDETLGRLRNDLSSLVAFSIKDRAGQFTVLFSSQQYFPLYQTYHSPHTNGQTSTRSRTRMKILKTT
jgi:hypothetical protein